MARRKSPSIFRRAAPAKAVFARAKPAAPPPKTASKGSFAGTAGRATPFDRWSSSPPGEDEERSNRDANISANVLRELEAMGLPESVLVVLRTIEWRKWYYMRVTVEDYEPEVDDDNGRRPPHFGGGSRRRIPYYGMGKRLLPRLLYLAEIATIIKVEIKEAKPSQLAADGKAAEIRPLWSDDEITLIDGSVISGSGARFGRRRRGRKKTRTGNRSHEEVMRIRRNERARTRRSEATQARANNSNDGGAILARQARSHAAWVKKNKRAKNKAAGKRTIIRRPRKK